MTRLAGLGGHSKYGNRRTWSDLCERWFDSKAEARRGEELWMLQKAGQICNLRFQHSFPLIVTPIVGRRGQPGLSVGNYIADFTYWDIRSVHGITEDLKGVKTPLYRLKKKLMKAIYGIEIQEVQ